MDGSTRLPVGLFGDVRMTSAASSAFAAATRASASISKVLGTRHTVTTGVSHIFAKFAYSLKSGGQVMSACPGPPKVKSRLKSSSSPPFPTMMFARRTPCRVARRSRRPLAIGSG